MCMSKSWLSLAFAAALSLGAVGCSSEPVVEKSQPIEMEGPPPEIEDAHVHNDEGPNGGQLIELGRSHEYHAEIVEDDEARIVTVHILGGEMQPWPIEQPAVTLSLLVDGSPHAFELQAKDPVEGKASRFETADTALYEALHKPDASGKLLVRIDGKSYSGVVEPHDHEH